MKYEAYLKVLSLLSAMEEEMDIIGKSAGYPFTYKDWVEAGQPPFDKDGKFISEEVSDGV